MMKALTKDNLVVRKEKICLSVLTSFFSCCLVLLTSPSSPAINHSRCPTQLDSLAESLLKDLPSYANRVRQRASRISPSVDISSYVVVAGRPEFEPLSLNVPKNADIAPQDESVQQLFFTTLERQYSADQAFETQQYHWLFLTRSEGSWRLVTLFSRFGSPETKIPPTPPQETSNGIVGQAVRLWLQDCRHRELNNQPLQ